MMKHHPAHPITTLQRFSIGLVCALIISTLAACSSDEAPKDIVQKAAIDGQNIFVQYNFNFDNLKVTNAYTRVIGGETVHFYDYSIDVHPKDPSNKNVEAMTGGAQTLTGEVELVKRGQEWFELGSN